MNTTKTKKLSKLLIIFMSTTVWVFVLKISWNHLSADSSYISAQKMIKKREFKKALIQANKSIEKNSKEVRYYYGQAKTQLTVAQVEKNSEEKVNLNKMALENVLKAEELNPNNLVTLRNNIPLYYFITQGGTNLDHLKLTRAYYKKVKKTFPNDLGVLTLLAKYETKLGLLEEFEQTKKMVQKLRPDILEWHPNFN